MKESYNDNDPISLSFQEKMQVVYWLEGTKYSSLQNE